jgi:signal transduction histidine kinase
MDLGAATFLEADPLYVIGVPFCVFVQSGHLGAFYAHLRLAPNRREIATDLLLRTRKGREIGVQFWSTPAHGAGAGLAFRIAILPLPAKHESGATHAPLVRSPRAHRSTPRSNAVLAAIAHELRNALMPLTMCLPLLKASSADAKARSEMQEICERQVDRMTRLIDDVLDLHRLLYGKIRLESQRIRLNDLVRSVAATHRPQFDRLGIALTHVEPPTSLYVDGDAGRLEQVLTNLLQNAAKFTERNGSVGLHLRREEGYAVLEVRDSGRGISPESLSRVFQPFVQVEAPRGGNRSGLGLGLALVKTFVELHHGTITAASPGIGQGAVFAVRLPLALPCQACA